MAALALCESIGIAPERLIPGLASFSSLSHRVEKVAEIDGVTYFDDSQGTNVGATLAALQGLGRKVAIILGGEGKDQDFTPLRAALAEHGGRCPDRARRAPDWRGDCRLRRINPDLRRYGRGRALVCRRNALAMPCCCRLRAQSFDMFRNYAHRAEVFIASVHRLESEAG